MGEHAVLYGHKALVFAINKRISATLSSISKPLISIRSQLGNYEISFDEFEALISKKLKSEKNIQEFPAQFRFVMASVQYKYSDIKQKLLELRMQGQNECQGFELLIESEFNETLGLGSSAAVVIVSLAVLEKYLNPELDPELEHDLHAILSDAHTIVHSVQGMGLGADLAASLFGGIIQYHYQQSTCSKASSYSIESLENNNLPIMAVYSGSKTPTPIVVKQVENTAVQYPKLYQSLYQSIGECVMEALPAIKNKDLNSLGLLMNTHHELLAALGVSNQKLDDIQANLNNMPSIYGAKISGAGLGDCVIGLGKVEDGIKDNEGKAFQMIPISIERKGLCYEL